MEGKTKQLLSDLQFTSGPIGVSSGGVISSVLDYHRPWSLKHHLLLKSKIYIKLLTSLSYIPRYSFSPEFLTKVDPLPFLCQRKILYFWNPHYSQKTPSSLQNKIYTLWIKDRFILEILCLNLWIQTSLFKLLIVVYKLCPTIVDLSFMSISSVLYVTELGPCEVINL